jgi:phosphopantetheinyl transferase (holo-ACP synthase)
MRKSEQVVTESSRNFYLGNDVVDLLDGEIQEESIHPRFDERVFSPVERNRLLHGDDRHIERWTHWALKEATLKAAKRHCKDIVFSPRKILVQKLEGDSAEVFAFDKIFSASIDYNDNYINATVVFDVDLADVRSVVAAHSGRQDESTEVRLLACQEFSTSSAIDQKACRIPLGEKIPSIHVNGVAVNCPVSLSHHGRFVAFAFGLPSGPWQMER